MKWGRAPEASQFASALFHHGLPARSRCAHTRALSGHRLPRGKAPGSRTKVWVGVARAPPKVCVVQPTRQVYFFDAGALGNLDQKRMRARRRTGVRWWWPRWPYRKDLGDPIAWCYEQTTGTRLGSYSGARTGGEGPTRPTRPVGSRCCAA